MRFLGYKPYNLVHDLVLTVSTEECQCLFLPQLRLFKPWSLGQKYIRGCKETGLIPSSLDTFLSLGQIRRQRAQSTGIQTLPCPSSGGPEHRRPRVRRPRPHRHLHPPPQLQRGLRREGEPRLPLRALQDRSGKNEAGKLIGKLCFLS